MGMEKIKLEIYKNGDRWCAVFDDFEDLQANPAGFGDEPVSALVSLSEQCGGLENTIMCRKCGKRTMPGALPGSPDFMLCGSCASTQQIS